MLVDLGLLDLVLGPIFLLAPLNWSLLNEVTVTVTQIEMMRAQSKEEEVWQEQGTNYSDILK